MAFPVNPYCWSKSAEHDVTLTTLTTDSKWHPSWVFFSMCRIVAGSGTANFKTKFPVLHELFAKNHRGSLDPSGARVNGYEVISNLSIKIFFYLCHVLKEPGKTIYHWNVHDPLHPTKIKKRLRPFFEVVTSWHFLDPVTFQSSPYFKILIFSWKMSYTNDCDVARHFMHVVALASQTFHIGIFYFSKSFLFRLALSLTGLVLNETALTSGSKKLAAKGRISCQAGLFFFQG